MASTNTRAALGEWKAFYVEPFLLFLVLISSLKGKKTADFILGALVLSGLATSLLAIYQHFTGWMVPWFFWANGNSYRVTAWYGFPNAVGLFLAPLVPLAIYLIREQWKKIKELSRRSTTFNTILQYKILAVAVLFIPTALLAILFAKSTGGLIGVAAGIGVLLLLSKKTRWPTLGLGIAALLVLFFVLPDGNPLRTELLMQDRSGQIRVAMWGEAANF